VAEVKPPPFELWQQAGGNPAEYRRLMREHRHLVPGTREPLPCGWPGPRASEDDDSQAGPGPVAGLGGVPVELAPGRQPAAEAAPPSVFRGPVPGGVAPGTAAPFPDSPLDGNGAATGTAGSTRLSAVLPAAGAFHDAPVPSLRLRAPEPPDEAA
jgi:hypothetical protein